MGRSTYASSKSALETISIILSKELSRYNTRVNVVSPGMVKTNMSKNTKQSAQDKVLSRISLRRFAEPSEIADLVYFLSSEKTSYINGEIFNIDGGLEMSNDLKELIASSIEARKNILKMAYSAGSASAHVGRAHINNRCYCYSI